jgi:hypothetical protein
LRFQLSKVSPQVIATSGSSKQNSAICERIDITETERRNMQNIVRKLQPAQKEIHQAAHDQDLVEVPRRALLDRYNDGVTLDLSQLERTDEAEK